MGGSLLVNPIGKRLVLFPLARDIAMAKALPEPRQTFEKFIPPAWSSSSSLSDLDGSSGVQELKKVKGRLLD